MAIEIRTNLHSIVGSVGRYFCKDKFVRLEIDADFEPETLLSRIIEATLICVSAAIIAITVENLNLMISIVGATYGSFLLFFLPAIVYYNGIKTHRLPLSNLQIILKYVCFIYFIAGIVIGVAGIVAAFVS